MDAQIGRNIAGARTMLGMSQGELAAAINERGVRMNPRTLGTIERGERDARASEVAAIADVLGVPISWFYVGPDWVASAQMRGWLGTALSAA